MKRLTSLLLSTTLLFLALPRHVDARTTTGSEALPMQATLVDSGKSMVDDHWVRTYNLYADAETGDVWGDGYVEDLESVDSTGAAGRWLSYTHFNGEFTFLGSDDGRPIRASFGPDDVTWTWDPESGWAADITYPGSGPQPGIWLVVTVVVIATALLAGDSGCSCGHNGGTENHPGTNHPGE